MSDKYDGGAAFPGPRIDYAELSLGPFSGMSLRDWFAGMALQGVCTTQQYDWSPAELERRDTVEVCYLLADAML